MKSDHVAWVTEQVKDSSDEEVIRWARFIVSFLPFVPPETIKCRKDAILLFAGFRARSAEFTRAFLQRHGAES